MLKKIICKSQRET